MEWLRISTSTEFVRVATDEIVCIIADGNYCDLVLTNGRRHTMTFQLHYFEEYLSQLRESSFARVGRSLIVNKRHIRVINVADRVIKFGGHEVAPELFSRLDAGGQLELRLGRDTLKELKRQMDSDE